MRFEIIPAGVLVSDYFYYLGGDIVFVVLLQIVQEVHVTEYLCRIEAVIYFDHGKVVKQMIIKVIRSVMVVIYLLDTPGANDCHD